MATRYRAYCSCLKSENWRMQCKDISTWDQYHDVEYKNLSVIGFKFM